MLGDVAIAVHPKDPRYANLVGRSVWLPPLFDRAIPIVADKAVDPEFGTGAVKVTPAHDPVDYEIGLRHSLGMPSVIGSTRESPAPTRRRPIRGARPFRSARTNRDGLGAVGRASRGAPHRHSVAISDRGRRH